MTAEPPARSWLRRWLREPLLHFLLLGGALFALYAALNPRAGERERADRIVLTEDDLRQLAVAWAAQRQRPPAPAELQALIDARVREEILYREALALGLDKGDTIVKRRLAQKMEFLAEDAGAIRDPAAAEIKAWFEQNRARFALPGRITFRHLYFSPDRRGGRARDAAANALEAIAAKPADSPAAAKLGDPFMFQDFYADRAPEHVASVFGALFAQALPQLKIGSWQGPVESGLGWHLVFIESTTPSRVPEFEEIEADVKADWIAAQRAEAKRRAFEAMRARYEVVLPKSAQ